MMSNPTPSNSLAAEAAPVAVRPSRDEDVEAMLDIYQSTYRAVPPGLNPFEFMQNYASAQGRSADASSEGTSQSDGDSRSGNGRKSETEDISDLRQRVAELEKLLSSRSRKKSSRKQR